MNAISRHAGASKRTTRADQRSRLLRAITDVVAERGYLEAQVAHIASAARVSCTTFYQLFPGKEGCFLAAHAQHGAALGDEFARAVSDAAPREAARAALSTLAAFAEREPAPFALLAHHALLAGPGALAARERLLRSLAGHLESVWRAAPESSLAPDLPTELVLGGAIRTLGMSTRRPDVPAAQTLSALLELVEACSVPFPARRWGALDAVLCECDDSLAPDRLEPAPLPKGRHAVPAAVIRRLQRERLLHATAVAVRAKGYGSTSVADIVLRASVSREVFYEHFANKAEAFAAVLKLFFESAVGAVSGAFFAPAEGFPERIWHTVSALLRLIAAHPEFARAAVLEAYAIDPRGDRIDDFVLAFAMFWREDRLAGSAHGASRCLRAAAVIGVVLEAVTIGVCAQRGERMLGLAPLIAHAVLAPVIGPEQAGAFLERGTRLEDGMSVRRRG